MCALSTCPWSWLSYKWYKIRYGQLDCKTIGSALNYAVALLKVILSIFFFSFSVFGWEKEMHNLVNTPHA